MQKHITEIFQVVESEYNYLLHKPKRILFDHLPKCAGSIVNEYLLSQYSRRVTYRINGWNPQESIKNFKAQPEKLRFKNELILGHLANSLIDFIHPETLKITIFRDPIERIISHYFFVKENKRHYLHDLVIKKNISLEDYVFLEECVELRNWYSSYFSGMLNSELLSSPDESFHKVSQLIITKYDIIGFQDNIPNVINKIQQSANLKMPFKNHFVNKTQKKLEVSDNARRVIEDANSLDVMIYNYLKMTVK